MVPSEVGSEAQEPESHYLASISQVYKLIFNTLDDDFCPRPIQSTIGSAVIVTEKVARRQEPDRVGWATAQVDLRLHIGSTITSVFDSTSLLTSLGRLRRTLLSLNPLRAVKAINHQ